MRPTLYGNRSIAVLALALTVGTAVSTAPTMAQEDDTLTVAEYALGTGVDEERNPVGRAETFAEGQQVWFWTRVVGGSEGQRIRHVWIKDGEVATTIGLTLGGPHWRTWSNKRMHPGSAGNWRAEVQDEGGKVLASAEFVCTAAGGE